MFPAENIKNWRAARKLQKEHDFALRINQAIDLRTEAESYRAPTADDFETGAVKFQAYYSFVFLNPDVDRFMESWLLLQEGKRIFGPGFFPTPPEELDTHTS